MNSDFSMASQLIRITFFQTMRAESPFPSQRMTAVPGVNVLLILAVRGDQQLRGDERLGLRRDVGLQ